MSTLGPALFFIIRDLGVRVVSNCMRKFTCVFRLFDNLLVVLNTRKASHAQRGSFVIFMKCEYWALWSCFLCADGKHWFARAQSDGQDQKVVAPTHPSHGIAISQYCAGGFLK